MKDESDEIRHGVFFYHVLEGLKGKARDSDGEVTFAGLAAYVSRRVSREVPRLIGGDARQSPNLKADYSTEPVLLGPEAERLVAQKPPPAKAPFGAAKAKELQQAWAKYLGRKVEEEVDLGGGVTMQFVLIPPGTFTMGSPKDVNLRRDNEDAHEVTLPRPFYLGKYAVTQEQYEQLAGKNPSYFRAGGEGKDTVAGQDTRRFPVEKVSWDEAAAFCDKLADKSGRKARLPSEAEWEYACRAGTTTPFHFGAELNGDQANCDGRFPYGTKEKGPDLGRPRPVGSYRPNAFGLYDMHGNVWQWCQDWYAKSCEDLPGRDPLRVDKGSDAARVLRGGSCYYYAVYCRAAFRYWYAPATRYDDCGFRVCFRLDYCVRPF